MGVITITGPDITEAITITVTEAALEAASAEVLAVAVASVAAEAAAAEPDDIDFFERTPKRFSQIMSEPLR